MKFQPLISVIIPSFNQADFIEETILSVIDQNYKNIELIIIDGGSSDGSLEIIEKYQKYIAFWVSEPDHGQSHAINKGLRVAKGEWVCWQNSDDVFIGEAFSFIADCISRKPNSNFIIGNIYLIDKQSKILTSLKYVKPTYLSLLSEGMVLTNQAAFWRKDIHKKIGYLAEDLHFGFDYEWFLRILKEYKAEHFNKIIGALRLYEETKTSTSPLKFQVEYSKFLPRNMPGFLVRNYFFTRRILLLIFQGNFFYVSRGFFRFLTGTRKVIK